MLLSGWSDTSNFAPTGWKLARKCAQRVILHTTLEILTHTKLNKTEEFEWTRAKQKKSDVKFVWYHFFSLFTNLSFFRGRKLKILKERKSFLLAGVAATTCASIFTKSRNVLSSKRKKDKGKHLGPQNILIV